VLIFWRFRLKFGFELGLTARGAEPNLAPDILPFFAILKRFTTFQAGFGW